jgi:hypothetical protein
LLVALRLKQLCHDATASNTPRLAFTRLDLSRSTNVKTVASSNRSVDSGSKSADGATARIRYSFTIVARTRTAARRADIRSSISCLS